MFNRFKKSSGALKDELARRAGYRTIVLAACLATPIALGGCKSVSFSDITGSIKGSDTPAPSDDESLRRYTEQLGKRYDSNPADKATAISYARALRMRQQHAQAVAVLQGIAIKNPKDMEVLSAYGKALADAGRLQEAAEVLQHAQTPERPNWSVLSAQGSVADRMGDHASAQSFYKAALKIAPDEPSILSNLGLSYALTKQLPLAEQTLRQAVDKPRADARVRENLTLVLSLEGKFTEAEQLGQRDLTPEQATANVAAVRKMIAQSDTWRDLRSLDKPAVAAAKPAKPPKIKPVAEKSADAGSATCLRRFSVSWIRSPERFCAPLERVVVASAAWRFSARMSPERYG